MNPKPFRELTDAIHHGDGKVRSGQVPGLKLNNMNFDVLIFK